MTVGQRAKAEKAARPHRTTDEWDRPMMQKHHRRGKRKWKDVAHRARRRVDRIECEPEEQS